jgi:hypothetical protein
MAEQKNWNSSIQLFKRINSAKTALLIKWIMVPAAKVAFFVLCPADCRYNLTILCISSEPINCSLLFSSTLYLGEIIETLLF